MYHLENFLGNRFEKIRYIIDNEYNQMNNYINLIGSANYAFPSVLETMNTPFNLNPSEGSRGNRFFPLCKDIDALEEISEEYLQKLFQCQGYYCNIEAYSGTQANQIVYQSILKNGDNVIVMDPKSGGHVWNMRYKGLFQDNQRIKEVHIPKNIEIIECQVFKDSALKSIVIHGDINEMGSEVFAGCESLEKIVFLKGINTVPSWAFSSCNPLKNISLPESVQEMESGAFNSCKSLERIDIYDKCNLIADNAFEGCDKLTIYGIKGSYVEQYANEYNIPFGELDTTYEPTN